MKPHSDLSPIVLVIFGAAGDLTRRKLVPAAAEGEAASA